MAHAADGGRLYDFYKLLDLLVFGGAVGRGDAMVAAAALDPPDHEAEAMGEENGTHEEGVVEFKSKFDKANHALQRSTVPSTMPCR